MNLAGACPSPQLYVRVQEEGFPLPGGITGQPHLFICVRIQSSAFWVRQNRLQPQFCDSRQIISSFCTALLSSREILHWMHFLWCLAHSKLLLWGGSYSISIFTKHLYVYFLSASQQPMRNRMVFFPFLRIEGTYSIVGFEFSWDVMKAMVPSTKCTWAHKFACNFRGFTNPFYELWVKNSCHRK